MGTAPHAGRIGLGEAGIAVPIHPIQETPMPRYLVERSFPNGLALPADAHGAAACRTVVGNNAEEHVTWIHSYVTPDRKRTYCVYDAPNPEAIRRTADRNALPVDRISEVRVLDPYFHF
jgi:hypothetical protein